MAQTTAQKKAAALAAAKKAQQLATLTNKVAKKVGTATAQETATSSANKANAMIETANAMPSKLKTGTIENADGTFTNVFEDGTYEIVGTPIDPLQTKEGNERRDAFASIRKVMLTYGFTEAEMKEIDSYISGVLTNPRIGPEQAIIDMRGLTSYKTRFAGNETRVKAGINALSEADYLAQEDSFLQYLTAGGVQNLGSRKLYADLIGGAVAPDEVGKRINIAVDRVQKADPEIKKQLKAFYPAITDADLVSYFLKPDQALVDLERKATAAEIGAAAYGKGFNMGSTADEIAVYKKSAEDLAAFGVDRAAALQGYGNVAEVLPSAKNLSSIYKEAGIDYNQATGEAEFFKGDTSAIEKRKRLKSLERAQFSGESAVGSGSLSRTTQGSF